LLSIAEFAAISPPNCVAGKASFLKLAADFLMIRRRLGHDMRE
jgi:hypothetical protein